MRSRSRFPLPIRPALPILFLCVCAFGLNASPPTAFSQDTGSGNYDLVLGRFVDHQGLVDYAGLKQERELLDRYISGLSSVSVEALDESGQLAFWINAYNALTLRVIIDHYPIRAGFFASLAYPKNSIRQISGAWDTLRFQVAGRNLTLDEIEHGIIRKEFDEPRIHVALVCAALGCPHLRNEAFVGSRLEEQLQDQSRRFLSDPGKFRVDPERNEVHMSSIFNWYGSDFVSRHTPTDSNRFRGHSAANRAVLEYALPFLSQAHRAFLESGSFRVRYLSYDWTLNER